MMGPQLWVKLVRPRLFLNKVKMLQQESATEFVFRERLVVNLMSYIGFRIFLKVRAPS